MLQDVPAKLCSSFVSIFPRLEQCSYTPFLSFFLFFYFIFFKNLIQIFIQYP